MCLGKAYLRSSNAAQTHEQVAYRTGQAELILQTLIDIINEI